MPGATQGPGGAAEGPARRRASRVRCRAADAALQRERDRETRRQGWKEAPRHPSGTHIGGGFLGKSTSPYWETQTIFATGPRGCARPPAPQGCPGGGRGGWGGCVPASSRPPHPLGSQVGLLHQPLSPSSAPGEPAGWNAAGTFPPQKTQINMISGSSAGWKTGETSCGVSLR